MYIYDSTILTLSTIFRLYFVTVPKVYYQNESSINNNRSILPQNDPTGNPINGPNYSTLYICRLLLIVLITNWHSFFLEHYEVFSRAKSTGNCPRAAVTE